MITGIREPKTGIREKQNRSKSGIAFVGRVLTRRSNCVLFEPRKKAEVTEDTENGVSPSFPCSCVGTAETNYGICHSRRRPGIQLFFEPRKKAEVTEDTKNRKSEKQNAFEPQIKADDIFGN